MGINTKFSKNKANNHLKKRIDYWEFDSMKSEIHYTPHPINSTEKQYSKGSELVEKYVIISLFMLLTITALQAQDQDRKAVTSTLDALHLYAHEADGKKYFSLYSDNAVFIGTDATERWPIEEFKTYAIARFKTGKGWTYTPTSRYIYFNENRDTAWFDEAVVNAKYGECRGTGVLQKIGGEWKISHYNLTVPVPNDLLVEVVEMIKGQEKSK